ncbi:MAG: DNA topoisomerase IV subunit A [Alphaproteobacteria bacterium]|nr:DNA topoisomerase IV subunit A [Alphaproteobacteria bacterium]
MTIVSPPDEVRETALTEALSERYLAYALSTITARSLPDVRDGLKPVHRRLLYAMQQLQLNPDQGFKKCARVVGDVIGKFHPHGDQAVYDALVRLAQSFAARYPLVDGQGNFGNIDGDNAAAMRYTEARPTEVAEALLDGIAEDTVDFRETYDGEESEPIVLPAAFPNLLANGATGIAVGMATSIPPHNAGELCDALLHLINFPKARTAKLVEFVPGPDFPTGGVLVEPAENVIEAYATGRGGFRLRARWEIEKQGRGQYQIVVTEVPYQVQKARLVEKIAELVESRKLTMLADVRDESADEVRIVLEPKNRSVDAAMLMETLFRLTDLEVRIALNLNVLDRHNTPRVMGLRDALSAFLEHRLNVLVRQTKFRLEKAERRLEVLDGYLIAFLNLDEVIRIIREEDEPKRTLMDAFELSDVQAEAVLNLRLRALRRLEEEGIRQEHADLREQRKVLKALLKDKKKRWQAIAAEIRSTQDNFGKKTALGRRRTELGSPPSAEIVPFEAMVEREDITVICSEKGWIRAVKGHVEANGDTRYKEGDRGRFWIHAETTDRLVLFGTNGRFYTITCDKIPRGRGNGDPVRLMVELGTEDDVVDLFVHVPNRTLLVGASDGRGFLVKEDLVLAQTRSGKQVLNVPRGVEAHVCTTVPDGADSVAVVGENRKLIVFPLSELSTMARGRGVLLQRYKDGGLSDAVVFRFSDGLSWRSGDRTRTEGDLTAWTGKRAQAGRIAPKGFPRSNRFV